MYRYPRYGKYIRRGVPIYMIPVIIAILVLSALYAVIMATLYVSHRISINETMYPRIVSWAINETKTLLNEALNGSSLSKAGEMLHGIGYGEFESIRVVNSDFLVMGNLTYRYILLRLCIGSSVVWFSNGTLGPYAIDIKILNYTGDYSGSYVALIYVYYNGVPVGNLTYVYFTPTLMFNSPQVTLFKVGNLTILIASAWYYLVVNKPEQLVNITPPYIYPHSSLDLWLAMIPAG